MDGRDVEPTTTKWHKKCEWTTIGARPSLSTFFIFSFSPVNAQDGDVVVQSSDNILFRLHRKNIEAYAGAFPLQATSTIKDLPTIMVPEPASVLQMVFEYLRPQRYPNLDSMWGMRLSAFANAIEKYEVFAAMQLCVARMR